MRIDKKVKYLDMALRVMDIPSTPEICRSIINTLDVIEERGDKTTLRDIIQADIQTKLTTWTYDQKIITDEVS